MFHVKIKLSPSKIHGIGLFAEENIPKGKIVYSINKDLDLFLSNNEFQRLSEDEKRTIKHYGYFDKQLKKWHLCFDDIRFCNHDANGNIGLKNDKLVAKTSIKEGEELTQNYCEFENLRSLLC
jgi:uncharacterized protein